MNFLHAEERNRGEKRGFDRDPDGSDTDILSAPRLEPHCPYPRAISNCPSRPLGDAIWHRTLPSTYSRCDEGGAPRDATNAHPEPWLFRTSHSDHPFAILLTEDLPLLCLAVHGTQARLCSLEAACRREHRGKSCSLSTTVPPRSGVLPRRATSLPSEGLGRAQFDLICGPCRGELTPNLSIDA